MIGFIKPYLKFSNTLPMGLKPAQDKGSTPPFTALGKINTSKLAPLSVDTVAFTGNKPNIGLPRNNPQTSIRGAYNLTNERGIPAQNSTVRGLNDEDLSGPISDWTSSGAFDNSVKNLDNIAKSLYRDMIPVASQIHEEAKGLQNFFEVKMCIFDCLLGANQNRVAKGTKGPLASKEIRVKSTYSIASKLANKFGEMMAENNYCGVLVTKDIAKTKIHDLLGARLILQNGQTGETNAVINQLIKSIESGNGPRIKAIKNYGKTYRYLTPGKIEQLEEVIAKAGYKHPEVTDRRKLSGYTATHIIIEVGNGIDAEIQILGRGVNRVKKVDDICYKGLQGKHIKGLSSEILKELKKVGQDPELTLYFNKYLTSAYELAKKEWDRMPDNELKAQKFPAIDTSKLPACLDLNNIEAAL